MSLFPAIRVDPVRAPRRAPRRLLSRAVGGPAWPLLVLAAVLAGGQAGTGARQFGPLQVVDIEAVAFLSGDLRLAGHLFLPRAAERRPALVLVHGSGEQDRRGRAGALRRMAEHFAGAGFVVLVYDKRGVGDSAGDWRTAGFPDLAADVVAAARFLASHPRVRPEAIGLVGFDQAGWVLPLAWRNQRSLAFVIAVSAPGTAVTPAEQHLFSVRTRALDAGASGAAVADLAAAWTALYDAVRRGAGDTAGLDEAVARARIHATLEGWLPPAGADIRWAQRDQWFLALDLDLDPGPLWQAVTSPVLAVYGLADPLVPVERVTDRLLSAGLFHALSLVVTIPGAGPLLTDGAPSGAFAPGAIEVVDEWLLQVIGSSAE